MIFMKATAISPLLQDLLKNGGELCGVFSDSLGISCGDIAVTVQKENIATPYGMAVAELYTKSVEWPIGEAVFMRDGVLSIGDFAQIDFTQAKLWNDMTIEKLPPLTDAQQKSALEAVKNRLSSSQRESGFSLLLGELGLEAGSNAVCPEFYHRALQAILLLRRSVSTGDLLSIVEAQTNLVGFGPGLTPSGDDFLVGFWTTMQMLADEKFEDTIKHSIEALSALSKRTTLYGWSQLHAMQKGFCNEPLRTAIKSLGNTDHQDKTLTRLTSLGGSTGLDITLGITESLQSL